MSYDNFTTIYSTFDVHVLPILENEYNTGCSIRVETLGNFDGKSSLPRQNWGTLEKVPR